MARINPTRIPGRWKEGFALDYHTVSSTYIGDDEFGHPQFETVRTELGELLLRLKYRSDASAIPELADAAIGFLQTWERGFELIVPVPPSRKGRPQQPSIVVAEAIGQRISIPVLPDVVTRTKEVPELKNIYEFHKRVEHLQGAHSVAQDVVTGKRILLFDDLFRSGATMNAVTEALLAQGQAAEVFALTITRTRSNR